MANDRERPSHPAFSLQWGARGILQLAVAGDRRGRRGALGDMAFMRLETGDGREAETGAEAVEERREAWPPLWTPARLSRAGGGGGAAGPKATAISLPRWRGTVGMEA